MLTNLSWLQPGAKFPPDTEKHRMEMYAANKALFESEHAEVYREDLKRIERIIGNFQQVISYPVIMNFQKLMSLKIADLLLGEPPIITADEQDAVKVISENSDLINTLYEIAIDVSRYGDGLIYIREEAGHGVIDITQPPMWYPIVSGDNVRTITNHVLAWCCDNKLKVQIHNKGNYEEREYNIENGLIGKLNYSQVIQTKLNDFAVIQISNVSTSDRATGMDDYTDVDSIIADIMVRIGQIDRILDKHASPSMSGPISALEKDAVTGEWRLKTGNYFPRETNDDPNVQYLTWEGQLTANFTQIEKLVNFLYTISEMGSALFGDMSANPGQVPSGSALRRLLISPLAKVNRIRMRFDPAVKKAIKLCSQLGGKVITDLTITWQDGLPGDPMEESLIMKDRTAGKATISQYSAMMKYDGLTDEQAEEELARIQDEDAANAPMATPPFSQGIMNDDTEDDTTSEVTIPQEAKTALNGAQMSSLLAVLESYQSKVMSRTAAINFIISSLPLTRAEAESIVEENE